MAGFRSTRWTLAILALASSMAVLACGAEPAPTPPGNPGRASSAPLAAFAPASALAAQVDQPVEEPTESAPKPPPVWVATHAITMLWDGPSPDALSVGRLPVGSYFLVIGTASNDRLPVRYLGNSRIPAQDGWVDLAAIGPIPEPGADWREPELPPRNLVLGQRGELIRGDPSLPLIALTFDAGAGAGAVVELLDVLRGRGVRSTFFVAGAFADRYPDIVRRMAQDGHELANHSYSHPDFRNLSEAQMRTETRRATASVESAAGVRIAPLWRPPFGSRNDFILRVIQEEGFRSVFWTFDSGDWLENTTTDRVRSTVLQRAVAGAVVVHHVSPLATARAMPDIIDELRRQGYELVTVSELIGP